MSSAMSQMRRLDELEAHYAVKKRELEAIQKDIAERQAQLELHSKNSKAAAAASSSSSTEAAAISSPKSPAAVPAVGRCAVVMQALASREYLETLPLYEAHNASSALRAAVDCEKHACDNLRRDIASLTTEYEQASTRCEHASKKLESFKRDTGFSTKAGAANATPVTPAAAKNKDQQQQQQSAPSSARSIGGGKAVPETEAMRAERQKKEAADAYILQMKKVEEHLKASRLLQKKLEASLKELDRAGHVQHETEMKVDQARNKALVLDRDIQLKQAELRDLRNLQAECDKEMNRIEKRRESEKEMLATINGGFRKVKGEVADVSEQKRQWEETIKAQDRRLAELRERQEMMDQAIDAHGLKPDVSRYVEAATAQRQQAKEGPQPADDLTDIISHYADVNMLAPPEETVPNGIIVLLTSLHDRLAHRVRCKEVLLEEKISAADALKDHVSQMVSEHDNSEDKLYAARVECEREVDDNVVSAKEALVDLREEYAAVKNVSITVQRKHRHESLQRRSAPLPDMQFKDKKQK